MEQRPLRILIVEDLSTDAELIRRELNGLGVPIETMVVHDGEGLKDALLEFKPDIVLSDYLMPGFSGMEALRIVHSFDPDLPFIIVTGSTNELIAVDCMKAGAWDYCLKEKLSRLVPAVRAALQKKHLIEEKKAATQALKASEEQFKNIIENSPIGMVVVGPDEKILFVNKVAFTLSRARDKSEVLGRPIWDFIHPSSLDLVKGRVERLREKQVPGITVERFLRVDGSELDVEVNSVPIKFNGAEAFLVIFKDITKERELIQRYQAIIENTSDAIFLATDGRFEFVNPRFKELFGYTLDELRAPGVTMLDLVSPESHEWVIKRLEMVRQGCEPDRFCEFVGLTKDGSKIYCEASTSVVELKGKRSVLGIIRDKTVERKVQDQLRKLSKVVTQNPLSIVITDDKGRIEYVNPAFSKITGYSQEEVIGKNPRILQSGLTPRETFEDLWTTILSKRVWKGEFINKKKDGSIFYEEAIISPILDESGEITNFVAVKEDITRRKELEERVRQAQKMEAIGTLAGGIAHDFNNILMPIMGYAELAQNMLPEGSKIKGYIQEIHKATKRAKDLVQQILKVSRQTPVSQKDVDIVPVVKETLKLLRAALPSTITLEQEISLDRAVIEGDPVDIHQVLMNLCINAQHAMPEGGTLRVELGRESAETPIVDTHPQLPPGEYIKLVVADTGTGIEKSILPKIFDPYFTTKEREKGTGLGLAVVQGVVNRSHGGIRVKSELGKGTTFTIFIPVSRDVNETDEVVSSSDLSHLFSSGRQEKILLIDDDPLVLELTEEMLRQFGYDVIPVMDPKKALERFKESPGSFHLVITDMTMPGITGDILLKAIREIRPEIPVIITTGYHERMDEEMAKKIGASRYLEKPFSMESLAEAVMDLLA